MARDNRRIGEDSGGWQGNGIPKAVPVAVVLVLLLVLVGSSVYVVDPGNRGVKVTLGKVSPGFLPEGFGFKLPFISKVHEVMVRQRTDGADAPCYSSDLQQVQVKVRVLYRVPESSVVTIFQEYFGDPFDSLILPRVQEALKEQTALLSAEQIVKQREVVKTKAIAAAKQKIGDVVVVEDLVLENIDLSKELEAAIELKMVQEQNANKARFEQDRRKIDSETKVIEARGEAEAIRIRGTALRENPDQINLQIVEKWDGRTPMYLGAPPGTTQPSGTNMLLPLPDVRRN
jgi:prohibitin 2